MGRRPEADANGRAGVRASPSRPGRAIPWHRLNNSDMEHSSCSAMNSSRDLGLPAEERSSERPTESLDSRF
jgi:hypothetical protein